MCPQPINTVNLKLLQTFMLVAEHSSFREAADRTHRSQSAISTQIKQLEAQVGVALFHRTTRRVRLTAEGQELLSSAKRALQEVSLGLQRIHEAVDLRHGRIVLGCAPTIAATRLAEILADFEGDFPKVQIVVRELLSKDLFEAIRRGDVDFGVGSLTPDGDLRFESLMDDDFFAMVPAKLMPGAAGAITMEELALLPVLALNPACTLYGTLEQAMRARGLALNTKYQVMQVQTVISMVRAELGVAVLPESVLPFGRDPRIRVLRVVPTVSRQVALIRRHGHSLSPAAERLAQLIRERIGVTPAQPRQATMASLAHSRQVA